MRRVYRLPGGVATGSLYTAAQDGTNFVRDSATISIIPARLIRSQYTRSTRSSTRNAAQSLVIVCLVYGVRAQQRVRQPRIHADAGDAVSQSDADFDQSHLHRRRRERQL